MPVGGLFMISYAILFDPPIGGRNVAKTKYKNCVAVIITDFSERSILPSTSP
jgi:hypothetical protein